MLHTNSWNLINIHPDALVIRDNASLIQTIPLNQIVGYGLSLNLSNDEPGHVDVILLNGSRIRIGSPRPNDLVQALDVRFG